MLLVVPPQHQQLLRLPRRHTHASQPRFLHLSFLPSSTPRRRPTLLSSSSPPSSSSSSSSSAAADVNESNRLVDEVVEEQGVPSRNHNSKSTSLLLHHLTNENLKDPFLKQHQNGQEKPLEPSPPSPLLHLTTPTKRTPKFPGFVVSPLPEEGTSNIDEIQLLRRALEIRRNTTADILMDLMTGPKSKLSRTYSTNLISRLPAFIDRVVVAASSMKHHHHEFSASSYETRAKAYIHESHLIPLIRWLKHNSLTYPQIGKLVCMTNSEDLDDPIRGLVEWLKSIYVKGRYLGHVLTKADGIIERNTHELEEIVLFLESHGLRREWMGFAVSRCPQILSLSMQEIESRVNFYLEMGMSDKDFGTMVFEYPKALGFFSMQLMKAKVEYLKEFGLSTEDLGRLLAFKPHLMGCSIEERWKPLVKYLYYLGVQRDGMKRILMMKPMIFCVDLQTTIVPKVRFLKDIGIREEAIGGVLVKFPPLLTYSLYKKIRPVVIFLIAKAGVTQRDIGKVIALEPELIGCSIINKLEVNVKYFLSLGISLQSLGEMIADFPMLLKYNLDVLRPKYQYLRRTMVRPLHDLIEFPRFFSYSLDGRIIPRHKALVENRVNFKLRYMLPGSDKEFDQRLKDAVDRRRMFESGGLSGEPFSSNHLEETERQSSE